MHRPALPFLLLAPLALCGMFASAQEDPVGEAVSFDPPPAPKEGRAQPVLDVDGANLLGAWICLSGTRTRNPIGKVLEYDLLQVKGPALRKRYEEPDTGRLWVLLDQAGEFVFSLRARNANGWSEPVKASFTVRPTPVTLPLEDAWQDAGFGDRVILPGEGWRQVAGPEIKARLADNGHETVLRPIRPGFYLFEALHAGEHAERRAVWVPPGQDAALADRRPEVEELPKGFQGHVGEPIEIPNLKASDPDGDPLKLQWLFPEARDLRQQDSAAGKAVFIASRKGIYRLTLIATDGKLESRPAETFLYVDDNPAVGGLPNLAPVDPNDPLSKKASLGLRESDLQRAVNLFGSRTGVTLRVDPDFIAAEKLEDARIDAAIVDAPARILLDWIARESGGRYRVDGPASVWLTRPDRWAQEEKLVLEMPPTDALTEDGKVSDLLALARFALRGVLDTRKDSQISYQPETRTLVASLPEPAQGRLKEIMAGLRTPKNLGLPYMPGLTQGEIALRRHLGEQKVSIDMDSRRSLDLVLRDFAAQTGFAVGFDRRQFPDGLPKVRLQFSETPLRDAVRTIVELAGFDGCQAVEGGGLWFYRGPEPYPSGEHLGDMARVCCYDVSAILAKHALLSGEVLAHHIKSRVYPGSWDDPNVSCQFHPSTGKLIVIHGEAAQRKVVRLLWDLHDRGEDALGPSESIKPKDAAAPNE